MSPGFIRLVLRADACLDAALGVLLLCATWDRLYTVVDLPPPRPVIYAQLAGGLLLGFAYLLWVAPADPALTRRVAGLVAVLNVAGAVLVLAWRLFTELEVGALGTILLLGVSAVLVALAVAEARIARTA